MFNKNGYKLKSDFRKILLSTNDLYQKPIELEEMRAIAYMWTKILGDNANIMTSRFRKTKPHFGFRITTTNEDKVYHHKIVEIVNNSDVKMLTKIEKEDILIEANGVNLLPLTYSELSIFLGSLCQNVQFVYWRKEGEYEKLDTGFDDKSPHFKNYNNGWLHPVNIIVYGTRKTPEGLEFINNSSSLKNVSKCVIQKINPNGYFFQDKRISVNDSILRINNIDVHNYQDKDMYKYFLSNTNYAMIICIGKYKTNFCGSTSDFSSLDRLKGFGDLGTRRLSKSQTINPPSLTDLESDKAISKEYIKLSITIDNCDDLGLYLVDTKDSGINKSIICGFNETSILKTKFKIGDQIVKINEMEVDNYSSLEIGKLLKNNHKKSDSLLITLFRYSPPYKLNHPIIIPCEPSISEKEISSSTSQDSTNDLSKENEESQKVFKVSLNKINNSFGLRIQSLHGPTITKVLTDCEIYQKSVLKPGDKIVRINDIYVLDKEHDFVLKIIRSCGNNMNLEILRIDESVDNSVEFINNPIYYPDSEPESSVFSHSERILENGTQSEKPSPKMPKIRQYLTKIDIKAV